MTEFIGNGVTLSGGSGASYAPTASNSSGMDMSGAMGYAGVASALISTVGNFFLAKTQAKAQKSALQFQSDLSKINQQIAEGSAQSELYRGQQEVAGVTMRYGALKSRQRAAMAANGVDLGTGNAAEVQASTDYFKENDKNTVEANAIRSAWGMRTQAVNFGNQATMQRASADSINPNAAGAAALTSGIGGVARSWYQLYGGSA